MDGPSEFQVSATVAVGKLEVALHVLVGPVVATLKRKGGLVTIPETKFRGVWRPLEEFGVLIKANTIGKVSEFVFFSDLFENLLVLWARSGLVDCGLPEKISLIGLLLSGHVLPALHIDGVLRFDAENFHLLSHRGPTVEPFIDRPPSELEVLLDLIAGNKLRGTFGIERAASTIGGQ